MKLAIISDIHGNVYALEATLKSMHNIDKIICIGDVAGYYYRVNEIFTLLEKFQVNLFLGNHDVFLLRYLGFKEPILTSDEELRIPAENDYQKKYGMALSITKNKIRKKNIDWFRSCNLSGILEIESEKILITHGCPWNPLDGYIYPDFQNWRKFLDYPNNIFIMGHTHRPLVKNIYNKTIINPGSVGQPRDYNYSSYAILDTDLKTCKILRVKYNVNKLINEVKKYEPKNNRNIQVLNRYK